jgi:arylsulfatase A-like enzyme/Flp pilus assembly protein TadD
MSRVRQLVPESRPQLGVYVLGFLVLALANATPPAAGSSSAAPNVVLLTLDTTRADRLGAAGWVHAQTPHLDALARRGTRFAHCDSAAPITLPSHATILTGLFPPRHGVRDNGTFALAAEHTTIAEHFAAAGFDTAAVVSAIVLARRHGLAQGFRVYDDDLGAHGATGTEVAERPAGATTDAALARLAKLKPPYFLWAHYYDPHEEYRPPGPFAEKARGPHRLYDGEISYMDAEVGRLLAALPAHTIVAVVADHGEMLGEHDETSHGLLLFAAARRVPLLLAGPGVPSGRTETCLARTADLAPTLLALTAQKPAASSDGASLLGSKLPADGPCAGPGAVSYSESFLPFFAYKWYPLRALSDGRELYLHGPSPSLFDVSKDLAEARDLAAERTGSLAGWKQRLEATLASAGEKLDDFEAPAPALTAEQLAQLQSLGYLGAGGGGKVARDLPDPRTRTHIARSLHSAATAARQGRCRDALRELQRIVKEDPHNFPALSFAAQCLRDEGRTADALQLFRRAAEENPRSAVPIVNVAQALEKLGQTGEAEREFRHALAIDPSLGEAATHLARLLRGRAPARSTATPNASRPNPAAEALVVLDGAIAAGAFEAELHRERGLALVDLKRLEEALAAFREAARRNPEDSAALDNAARTAFHLDRPRDAAIHYETALRLRPDDGPMWRTLGAIYLERLDDPEQAERCFRQALRLTSDPWERAALEAVLRELGAD